jgi:hypothetical protein
MKVKIGMEVMGNCDTGRVVAMSKDWCIYQVEAPEGKTFELAELWDDITIPAEIPEEAVSSIEEKEIP